MSKIKNGGIPEGWEEYSLGNIAKFKNGKSSPERNDTSLYDVFGSNGVIGRSAQFNSSEETVIVGRVGSYCGSVYFSKDKCWVTDNAIIGSPLENVDARFLYYLLLNLNLNNHRGGSGQPLLNQGILNSIDVLAPTYDEQRAIAKILSDLDAKIELNHQMNKTLEHIAQAIFKQWFVDFEFPGHEKSKFVNGLPEGWQNKEIRDCGEVICGKTPPTSDKENYGSDISFVTIPDMRDQIFVISTERKLSKQGANSQRNKTLPPLAVCVSCIATPGLISLTSEISQTNQQINSIICGKDISPYFMYLTMVAMSEEIKAMGLGGTATLNLNTGNFAKMKVIIPDSITMNEFHEIVDPAFEKLLSNARESINLSKIRDSLLPRLMSGKIRAKNEVFE